MTGVFKLSFIILLFCGKPLQGDPFGKDADLTKPKKTKLVQRQNSLLSQCAYHLIDFHQHHLSPTDGPRSHFYPSSSQYALNAIEKYGFLKGFCMGADRLLRENTDPWVYPIITTRDQDLLKYDPVK